MNNTCPPRFTAAAGTKFAGASYSGYRHNRPQRKSFTVFTFIAHATLLDQAKLIVQNPSLQPIQFGPFSFPLWLIVLSDQLKITGLVGRYLYQLP